MILTESIKQQLIQCSSGLISNDISQIINYRVNFNEFQEVLNCVYNEQNQSLFEAVLWCMPNCLSHNELEIIYSKYIILNNHKEHENIIGLFQSEFYDNIENISVLLQCINNIPEYLSPEDFKYPYIRKIIYAIGAQPEPYNIEALEKIANETEDEQIKELALHQIKKRKEFGRWESAENIK